MSSTKDDETHAPFNSALGDPVEQPLRVQEREANNNTNKQQNGGDTEQGIDPLKTMQDVTKKMNEINKAQKKYKRQYQQMVKSFNQLKKVFTGCFGDEK